MKRKADCLKNCVFCIVALTLLFCPAFALGNEFRVPGDYPTIQAAIDATIFGDTVLVADGTYTGAGNKNLDFKGKAITVRSENGPENCIIDCENNGRGFYFHSGEGEDSVVFGFSIIHGKIGAGGGILCNSSSPAINNCVIRDNAAGHRHGGGIYCYRASPVIRDCVVSNNSAVSYGGGIYCYTRSSPTIANCRIENNSAKQGAGIFCQKNSSPTIINCTVSRNSAKRGGGVLCKANSSPIISNCIVSQNSAKQGAGIFCQKNSSPTIINCTVSRNSAKQGGGVLCKANSSPIISNCILWGDTPDEILRHGKGSNPGVTYSDVQGGYAGVAIIDADPSFLDAANHDYHLTADSPCIDTGTSEGAPGEDFDGLPRPQGNSSDMGAYEYAVCSDADDDDVCDNDDNCPDISNADQADTDGDKLGDACDACPDDSANDADSDSVCGNEDNCPEVSNADQTDTDGDTLGDACDICPDDPGNDADSDSVCGNEDNCPEVSNADQTDTDGDTLGDACDEDDDNDGVNDADDAFPLDDAEQSDNDEDGIGDNADPDDDNDGVNDADDPFPFDPDNCSFVNAIESKLTADDGAQDDYFGFSVSVSGNYAIAGAFYDDDKGSDSGSAYVFKRDGTSWIKHAKLTTANEAADDRFGSSLSLSGNYAIVGAYRDDDNGSDSGSAYIFHYDGTSWIQQTKLTASDGAPNDHFGRYVSMSDDYAIVGALYDDDNGNDSGSAYVFKREGTSWVQQAKLIADDGSPDDHFGESASVSGNYAVVGASGDDDNGSDSGSVYVFKRDGASWAQQVKLTADDGAPGDHFGHRDISVSGDYIVVGAYGDDDNGSDSGSVYIFKRDETSWTQQAKLTADDGAPNDHFGISVSASGHYVVVGAFHDNDYSGAAYVFKRDGTSWTQQAKLTADDGAPGDAFGSSVSMSGNYAIVGAYGDDDNGSASGSAYIYEMDCFTDSDEDGVFDNQDNCPDCS